MKFYSVNFFVETIKGMEPDTKTINIIYQVKDANEDKFGKFLAFGITFGLAFQALLNLMVVVGLIPVTGVTLPFLSYGGSSLLITLCSMGILLSISKYSKN